MFVSGWKLKTRKISVPFLLFCESLVPVKENTDSKRKKKEDRKEYG